VSAGRRAIRAIELQRVVGWRFRENQIGSDQPQEGLSEIL
jgi:hypothetical protein